jgi:hypothetical protein
LKRSPAQTFALVIGLVLVVLGGVGFAYSATFGAPGHTGSVLGIFEVNGWHNVLHVVTGVLGLMCAGGYAASRRYAFGLAILFGALAIAGWAVGDHKTVLSIIPVNTEDDFLHAFIAVWGCAAGGLTPAAPPPSVAAGEPGPGFRFD